MSETAQRELVLQQARRMLARGVRYQNPSPPFSWALVHANKLPASVDCSRFVEYAVMLAFPDSPEGLLSPGAPFTTARGMADLLAPLDSEGAPKPGDLAIYTGAPVDGRASTT